MQPEITLMIIGVDKAGTTALFRHLAQSPVFSSHAQREMFYFLSDEEFNKGWEYAMSKYYPTWDGRPLLAKNVMQVNSQDAMARMKATCPEVKCIMMLREPSSRAYSAYNYARLRGAETARTFEEALELEDQRYAQDPSPNNPLLYLRNSTYAPRVRQALHILGKDNLLVLFQEDYRKDMNSQLEKIQAFFGQPLFDGITPILSHHNRAARARSNMLARLIHRLLKSRNPLKRAFRSVIPHQVALKIRHGILNFNRIEAKSQPIRPETASLIRNQLNDDRQSLIDLLGRCPWDVD